MFPTSRLTQIKVPRPKPGQAGFLSDRVTRHRSFVFRPEGAMSSNTAVTGRRQLPKQKQEKEVSRRARREDLLVAARIRTVRVAAGTTQKELSAALGISRQQLTKYECAKNLISAGYIITISRALGVPADHLLSQEDDEPSIEQTRAVITLVRDFGSLEPEVREAVRMLVHALAH